MQIIWDIGGPRRMTNNVDFDSEASFWGWTNGLVLLFQSNGGFLGVQIIQSSPCHGDWGSARGKRENSKSSSADSMAKPEKYRKVGISGEPPLEVSLSDQKCRGAPCHLPGCRRRPRCSPPLRAGAARQGRTDAGRPERPHPRWSPGTRKWGAHHPKHEELSRIYRYLFKQQEKGVKPQKFVDKLGFHRLFGGFWPSKNGDFWPARDGIAGRVKGGRRAAFWKVKYGWQVGWFTMVMGQLWRMTLQWMTKNW